MRKERKLRRYLSSFPPPSFSHSFSPNCNFKREQHARSLTDGLGRFDHRGAVRHIRVQFRDEDEDDGDQEEEVGDDGADAGYLVDPVVGHVGHPTATWVKIHK